MMIRSLNRLWPILLIPVFFILNAANEYFGDLDVHFFLRFGGYLFLLLIIVLIFNFLILRNVERVLAFSYVSLLYLYFTKDLYKLVELSLHRSVFFLLTVALIVGAYLLIRKADTAGLARFNKGLLLVFSALIIFETGTLLYHSFSGKGLVLTFPNKPVFGTWTGSGKPNIYLLLFDEYQGNEGLKNLFDDDNGNFRTYLKQQQFQLVNKPRSNYNYTYFSVPSMFTMSYLQYSDGKYDLDFARVLKSINTLKDRNHFANYLAANGYAIANYSLFDFAGQPTPYDFDGLDEDAFSVLFSRTLPGWFKTDLLHLVPGNGVHRSARDLYFQFYDYNRSVLKDTEDAAGRSGSGPVFVYSHFLLPHLPVVTDSSGNLRNIKEAADELHKNLPGLKQSYLGYTKYANKICMEIINRVIANDSEAVILVVSDHGLRRLLGSSWVHDIQMAVRMPGRPDPGLYDEMTSVNLLRVVLNGIAGQKLEMLPDSVVSVK